MSTLSYNKWWIQTKTNLKNLKQYDKRIKKEAKSTRKRSLASHLIGGLFARYSRVVQDIDTCLDQMCQVQRSATVRKLMDAATQRLHELKQEMVQIDISEYHYIDGALIELKLIPHDIEILHPALFYPRPLDIQEMWKKILAGEKIYIPPIEESPSVLDKRSTLKVFDESIVAASHGNLTEGVNNDDKDKKKKKVKKKMDFMVTVPKLSVEEEAAEKLRKIISQAVQMIQNNERARQGRLYSHDINTIKKNRDAEKAKKAVDSQTSVIAYNKYSDAEVIRNPLLEEKSSLTIQSMWRSYATRAQLNHEESKRRLLIQMIEPSWKSTEEFDKLQKTLETRRKYRDDKIAEYIQTKLAEKDRVLRVIGPGLFEDIGDEIREWFHDWFDNAKNFDKYPSVEKGGTVVVVRGETMTPKEWIDEVERRRRERVRRAGMTQSDKDKQKAEKEKNKKEQRAAKKKEAQKKKKLEAALKNKNQIDFEFNFGKASPQLAALSDALHENHVLWHGRNINDNPLDVPYMDIITDQKCYELQLEVRQQVDEMMRLELDLLNDALARDRAKAKGKKGKKHAKKKKKGKKRKKGKKGKKDITGHRTTEDLFQELYDTGIIRTYPKASMDQFRGDFSFSNWEKRIENFDPPAALGDVRQAVILNCVLPLGVEVMEKPKSLIIAGPHQSGKHLLANAIFNTTKCVLFDVSPTILAGKYTGKEGMKMLLHLINKMSRILQPSIIFIDGAEKPFYKKVPKNEKALEPKKMGGKLFKNIIKPITKEDRVMVLGITHQPWAGKAGGMRKAYQKVILIPRPDYGSTFLYWRELLMPFHGVNREFNFTALTTLTWTYPPSAIKAVVERVLTPRRLIRLKYEPLNQAELVCALLMGPQPITEKEWKKFSKWYNKTPLGKGRARLMKTAAGRRQNDGGTTEQEKRKRKT